MKMMKQQDRFKSNLQFVSSINREHEIDINTQTQSVEIGNERTYRNSWTLEARLGRWTLDVGLWKLDSGLWTLDSRRWLLNSRRWTPDIER